MFVKNIYSISNYAVAEDMTYSTINVKVRRKRQFCDYICQASNNLDTFEIKIKLKSKYKIICTIILFEYLN